MKRKRGSKKGKAKKPKVMATNEVASNAEEVNTGNDSVVEEELESDGSGSGGEDEGPSSTGTDQAQKPASANSGGFSDSTVIKAVYGRVKVKIKNSKALDSQVTTSETRTQNDAEKSFQYAGLEKQGVSSEKMEDSANSLSETNNVSTSGDLPKKSAGIKIKTKNFSSNISPCINAETLKGEKTHKKEPYSVSKDSRYNKKELDAAVEVIKKVMKMEAAEPFNTPVDPVALGIPDYFDVIDTPMDFGTIRTNLESGGKYLNSEDVYKDVQYIWDNCYKYNNKGDLVLDLMKRVKKNFSKYWSAAGLYSDYTQVESSQIKDATPDSTGKEQSKGGPMNNKSRKLHGLKKHKDGCLCAICVMMRRRQEREESARVLEEQMETSSEYPDEAKPEVTTPAESLGGDYASSNMENSPELDIDSNQQEKAEEANLAYSEDLYNHLHEEENRDSETDIPAKKEGQLSALMQLGSRSAEDHTKHQKQNMESDNDMLNHTEKETLQTATSEQHKPKEKLDKYQKAKMLEKLRHLENPRIFELCGTLFGDDKRSVWNGPRSLVQQNASTRKSAIRAAVSKLMQ
ncbi:bromodomain-containing protein C631.02 [Ipomoea triloba]|uniref:bromodomain-containing protein C631.02 n=1 Tax=Ipomoea triloba TaxID=35885 RepID=UPI00125D482E|nr:bromodomain-containing protein C631.02 [Ipomoea triloba]XP_031128737.1 bromodomain-containing protein C631.02 [Ipomoea triloba]